jgi:predicted metalloprotease
MRSFRLLFLAFAFVGLAARAHALEFHADKTPDGIAYIMVHGQFLSGDDLSAFERLVASTGARDVGFDSPGGDLPKAMELGRLIRRLDLGTIAVRQLECSSACALAFLGGTMRMAQPGSIGVHRASFAPGHSMSAEEAVEAVQQGTAEVMRFIGEMGADAGLLQLALSYGSSDMRYLSTSEMEAFRVINATMDGAPLGNAAAAPAASSADVSDQFIAVVLAETEDHWNLVFEADLRRSYDEPKLVLFTGQIASGCGQVRTADGPSYCAADRKIYVDLAYLGDLPRLGISGDFAVAFLIAREVGHHVQNLMGVLAEFDKLKLELSEQLAGNVRVSVELQADCLAGLWARTADKKGLLEQGDLDEAINAARRLGDDAASAQATAHGTSEQRAFWLRKGFDGGKLPDCDTFGDPAGHGKSAAAANQIGSPAEGNVKAPPPRRVKTIRIIPKREEEPAGLW